jgi:hypothetical protein
MTTPLRRIHGQTSITWVLAVSAVFSLSATRVNPAVAQLQPVLVELFTSEGCSDCPPADALLEKLDQQQFVPGAHAIVLSEHVTYWNHEGWRDPFSFALMDQRQQQFARTFALDTVYTPQVVVDGVEQLVGSDAAKLQAAVTKESTKPKLDLDIENIRISPDGHVSFNVHLPPDAKGTLIAALAQNATVSQVSRGENAGRTLHHVAVVRAMMQFSAKSAADGRTLSVSDAELSTQKSATPLRLVVFLADGNGKVMGAAEQTLRP